MVRFNHVTLIFIISLISAASTRALAPRIVQRTVQAPAYRRLIDRLISSGNSFLLGKLLQAQEQRARTCLQEEHFYDVGILQGACTVVNGSRSRDELEQKYKPFATFWDQLELFHAYKNHTRLLFLKTVTGCDRVAFVNLMESSKLTIAQLEKERSLYQQENSLKSQAMAEWLSVKIESKKLEEQLEAVRPIIDEKEAPGPLYFHYSEATQDHVQKYLWTRDLERRQAQLRCLYAALKK